MSDSGDVNIQGTMSDSGDVKIFQWDRNDYFLEVYSFTHGSTRWWCLKSPEMDQKSSRASPASGYESSKCVVGGDPFDSSGKSSRHSP